MELIRRLLGGILSFISGDRYPVRVELPAPDGEGARFEVRTDVERFRVEGFGGEEQVLRKFLSDVNSDDVVYDVGASVGLMTVMAAKSAHNGRIIAFEPDPETRRRLATNIELNHLSNVDVVAWAASKAEGTALLHTNGAAGFAPSLRQQTRDGAPHGKIKVPTRRIDDALEAGELPVPSVLKIDVEGAEGFCLRGAKGLLGGRFGPAPRVIYLELHPTFLPEFGSTATEVESIVTDLGYVESWRSEREDQVHVRYRRKDSGS